MLLLLSKFKGNRLKSTLGAHRILEHVTPCTTDTKGKIQTWLLCDWLHHSFTQQGYTEWATIPLSCVKAAVL